MRGGPSARWRRLPRIGHGLISCVLISYGRISYGLISYGLISYGLMEDPVLDGEGCRDENGDEEPRHLRDLDRSDEHLRMDMLVGTRQLVSLVPCAYRRAVFI